MTRNSEWQTVRLEDLILQARYGLSLRGAISGAVPMLRMNCQSSGRVVFRDLQYVDLNPDRFDAYRLEPGDLLFNRTNSYDLVGRTAIFRADHPAVFASYLIRLRLNRKRVDPEFLNLQMNWPRTQRTLKAFASRGVSQSNISASKLKGLVLRLPPMEVQRAIAAMLLRIQE